MVSHLKWIVVTTLLVVSHNLFALPDSDKIQFKTSEITLVSGKIIKKIKVELAETEDQHERGLMFRKSLPKDQGMLFVFKDEMIRSFWMKNTLINLSIGYFNKDKKLIDIQEMKATNMMQTDFPNYPSQGPAQFALEMPEAWFAKNKIEVGAFLKQKGN